jgi:hypothetical protein
LALSFFSLLHIPSFTLQSLELTGVPPPPGVEEAASRDSEVPTYLGITKRLPEFNLVDKVVLVSGAARGLGLVQAEALLEAGAIGRESPYEVHPSPL